MRYYLIASIFAGIAFAYIYLNISQYYGRKQPNILFIIADDIGWADVGYHGSDFRTPNIDYLANNGIKLNSYYVQSLCTPTRTSLMTGRYPIRYGLQHSVIIPAQPKGLSLDETLLPQYLQNAGYVTRYIGKWHLGFYRWAFTPTKRGFNSFYGFYNAQIDHFNQTVKGMVYEGPEGFDFRRDTEVEWSVQGNYSTYLYTAEAQRIISSHNQLRPLFLMLSHSNIHWPLQVLDKYYAGCPHVPNLQRRTVCAMAAALDESVGAVIQTLRKSGMWDNTLIIFSTDNGGTHIHGGNNYPLRGAKFTLWEGGIRGVGFLSGGFLSKTGTVSNALMHVTDWLPTLVNLVGGKVSSNKPLDGYDMWEAITASAPSPRQEILHNINPVELVSSIRVNEWKLLHGDQEYNDWYKVPTDPDFVHDSRDITNPRPPNPHAVPSLFNLSRDPYEQNDVAAEYPEVVKLLLARIEEYKKIAVPPEDFEIDPASFPHNFGGAWSPWRGE